MSHSTCQCGNAKRQKKYFCNGCFLRLPHDIRNGLDAKEMPAFSAALEFLDNAQAAKGHPLRTGPAVRSGP